VACPSQSFSKRQVARRLGSGGREFTVCMIHRGNWQANELIIGATRELVEAYRNLTEENHAIRR
jgi:hypothetical protein